LLNLQNQLTDLQKRLDREYRSASQVRVENGQLKGALAEAEAKVQESEEQAQAYYDQGFSEATDSLMSQLKDECNTYFVLGWTKALDNAEVDDSTELYDLARRHRPFRDSASKERNEEVGGDSVEDPMIPVSHEVSSEPILTEDPEMPEDQAGDQIQAVEPQEGEDGSDDENIDVID
jgi:regulator of replication initiation timing